MLVQHQTVELSSQQIWFNLCCHRLLKIAPLVQEINVKISFVILGSMFNLGWNSAV
jgi:hypothetical protein